MSGVENLAKFGLFLILAFAIPGLIYVGFTALYFPTITNEYLEAKTFVDVIGLSLFLGFLITSICFVIELRIVWPGIEWLRKQPFIQKRKWLNWDTPEITKIGEFEARGLNTFYLNQVLGQYTCHLNVSIGVGILLLLYLIVPKNNGISQVHTLFGLIIFIVNGYLALKVFRPFSIETIKKYQDVASEKKCKSTETKSHEN